MGTSAASCKRPWAVKSTVSLIVIREGKKWDGGGGNHHKLSSETNAVKHLTYISESNAPSGVARNKPIQLRRSSSPAGGVKVTRMVLPTVGVVVLTSTDMLPPTAEGNEVNLDGEEGKLQQMARMK